METHLKIIGALLLVLSLLHLGFPHRFHWREELATLSLLNRQIMQVHTFFIGFTLFLMGLLCLFCAPDLVATALGKTICRGLGIFWSVRLLFQFFVYSPRLWRGKIFETGVHILFSLLWLYLSAIFFLSGWQAPAV